jgi:hypothetical protein
MAKTPSKKTAKTAKKASTEGKKKRKSKRTETFNTYLYKVRRSRSGRPRLPVARALAPPCASARITRAHALPSLAALPALARCRC